MIEEDKFFFSKDAALVYALMEIKATNKNHTNFSGFVIEKADLFKGDSDDPTTIYRVKVLRDPLRLGSNV